MAPKRIRATCILPSCGVPFFDDAIRAEHEGCCCLAHARAMELLRAGDAQRFKLTEQRFEREANAEHDATVTFRIWRFRSAYVLRIDGGQMPQPWVDTGRTIELPS